MATWFLVATLAVISGHVDPSLSPTKASEGAVVSVAAGGGVQILEHSFRRLSSRAMEKPDQRSSSQYDLPPAGSVPVVGDVRAFTVTTVKGRQPNFFPFIVMVVQCENGESEAYNLATQVTKLQNGTHRLVSPETASDTWRAMVARFAGTRKLTRILLGLVTFPPGSGEGVYYPVEVQSTR